MRLRTRLTLWFTLLTAVLLLTFATVIYLTSKQNRQNEFFEVLKNEGITKANLFFETDIDPLILQEIYLSNREVINEVEVAIYDPNFNLLYHDAVEIDIVKESPEMIDEIIAEGEIRFYENDWQVIGFRIDYNGIAYAVTAAAFDGYGYSKLFRLKRNMLLLLLTALALIFLLGMYFSRSALQPIKSMIDNARAISATNLDLRLSYGKQKDELTELAQTFNAMLDRLEYSFDAQKQFVSNIAHELRTPLSAMIAELDLASQKEMTTAEYEKVIQRLLDDTKKMESLSSSLLDLARASYDTSKISFKPCRIDELILDAVQDLQQLNPEYITDLQFTSGFDGENAVELKANPYLIRTAFLNLMENACKFSLDKRCKIELAVESGLLHITFTDNGPGIPPHEQDFVFEPFFRGRSTRQLPGTGIGLPLAKRIVELHSGIISLNSIPEHGTTIGLKFKL